MPIDRGAIDAQLRQIGEGERWWEQREFRDLPYILHPDETIQGICTGQLGPRRPRLLPASPWLILVSSQRLLCIRQERFGRKQVDIPAGQITAIRQQSRLRSHQVTLETPQQRYRLRIAKTDAFRFVGALASLMPPPAPGTLDIRSHPLSWIPGMNTLAAIPGVAGVVSRVAMLSPPDYATRAQLAQIETTVEALVEEVERLRQQVQFLERLLERRADEGRRATVSTTS